MAKKKNSQLTTALIKYYITFLIVFSVIFLVAYVSVSINVAKHIDNNQLPIYDLINGEYKDYKSMDISDLKNFGGYIEVLDNNKNVIYRNGSIPLIVKDSYSENEFIDAISQRNSNSEYYTFTNTIQSEEDKKYIVLINVPQNKVDINIHLESMQFIAGKPILKIYLKVVGVTFILSIAGIIAYSIWTARKFKKPLKIIDDALGKVIEGDYNKKLSITGEKEFVAIGDTINFLIDKLKSSQEENVKLQESKTRMLMDLSHDIKTPITTIRGFSAALSEGLIQDEEKKEKYYRTINSKSERVAELVDDLFEFVKMDSSQYVMKLEKTDICEFVRQIIVAYFDEIEDKGFEIDIRIPDEIVELKIDVKLFKRVITNLIENSLKYNPRGTVLRVEIKNFRTYVMIYVADTGVGISSELRGKIFDAFVRGDASRSSDGGSGLGLAIASKIVENHGGEISLNYPKGDEKTIFAIRMYKDI
ncbi:MAG: HAMP domain-containing sensor histidine kinase [Clostridiaceae bacterium]|nr:HAMP domain-containing sensor histidine kinase [Clostridiaceae bacterium]